MQMVNETPYKAARMGKDGPLVLEMPPIQNGRPFPTIFWLVCPVLKKEISHLERDGLIQKTEFGTPSG